MQQDDYSRLERMLCGHEGLRLKPYLCSAGRWTVGVGRNISDNPLTTEEQVRVLSEGMTKEAAMWLLRRDIRSIHRELGVQVREYQYLDAVRQDVLLDMAYNLGVPKLLQFKKMFRALSDHDYQSASREMLDSRWANQVGQRAKTLAWMMSHGRYPDG